jgi:hypothetical protein
MDELDNVLCLFKDHCINSPRDVTFRSAILTPTSSRLNSENLLRSDEDFPLVYGGMKDSNMGRR